MACGDWLRWHVLPCLWGAKAGAQQHPAHSRTTTFCFHALADVADAIRKGLGVGTDVLSNAVFNGNGIALTWQTTGPSANTHTYQVRL